MRVIITAGGTGGHIYPALAIVDKIKEKEPDSTFLYIGTHNRMEKDIVPSRNIDYIPLEIYGLSTSLKLMGRNIKNVFLIEKAYKKCLSIVKEFKPDVVIGVGGYVTYPVIRAAHKCGIKTVIHEQNSIPGKANKILLRWVSLVAVSFSESKKYIKHDNVVLTGNPVSEMSLKQPKVEKSKFGLDNNKKCVLIVNGSLGSNSINRKMVEYLKSINDKDYEVLYITGKPYYETFKQEEFPKNVFLMPYIDNLSGLMKSVDLIISRAGASSISEIKALGIPTIFIPSPYVANNHQYYNALSMVKADAALMIEEKNLNKDILNKNIDMILNDKEISNKLSTNLKKLSINDSATIIYDEIKKIL